MWNDFTDLRKAIAAAQRKAQGLLSKGNWPAAQLVARKARSLLRLLIAKVSEQAWRRAITIRDPKRQDQALRVSYRAASQRLYDLLRANPALQGEADIQWDRHADIEWEYACGAPSSFTAA